MLFRLDISVPLHEFIAKRICFKVYQSYPLTQWDFSYGVGPLWFSIGSFCIQNQYFLPTRGPCLEVVFVFE